MSTRRTRASLGHGQVVLGQRTLGPLSHAIVIPAQATPQERHAAADLQYHLELITGRLLPLLTDDEVKDEIPLVVGRSQLLKKLGVDVDFDALGLEGIAIETKGPALVLAGNKRGVLYAVYTFLVDYLGCRWFTSDCVTWPREGQIEVGPISRHYVPPLEYRATDYPNSRDADWAVRNKVNSTQTALDEERGGKITYAYFVHTFNALIPPERYFDEHSDWFSEINGVRIRDHAQLCLTNPEMLAEAKRRLREWIETNPNATIFSVSQNDWHNYCQCQNCTALAEQEGSQSGPLLHFVNTLAESVEKNYPRVIIDTLAYQYTRKPPKHVKPRPNVVVRLCSIECAFNRPLATDSYNRSFVDDVRGWNQICNRLHIWDYVIDYSHCVMPFPNLYVLKPNIKFFIENGVTGVYEEANYFSKGGEFAELRTYIMAKTLWDPTYDTDKAIDEFLAAYYGPADGPLREYINLTHQAAQKDPNLHMIIWTPPTAKFLSADLIRRAVELFDQAEAAVADDPTRLHRVQVARLPVMYVQIAQATSPTYHEEGDALVDEAAPPDVSQLTERFGQIARAEGLTHIREGAPNLDEWLQSLPKGAARLPLERLRNPALEVSVLPAVGGRIWRIRTLPDGRDVLKVYGTPESLVPSEGGYEEYSQSGYRSPGWREPYQMVERTERSVRLELRLKNGLVLQRAVELDAEKPLLRITSTLTNAGSAAQTAGLRVHPAFTVTSTQKAVVKVQRGKEWETIALTWPKDPQAGEQWFRDAQRPDGAWAVLDQETGRTLVNRFDPAQVGIAYLYWSGKGPQVNLEMWTQERKLEPGEAMTLEHTYEVLTEGAGL